MSDLRYPIGQGVGTVRGILVASDFPERVQYAARAMPNLALRRYRIQLAFEDASQGKMKAPSQCQLRSDVAGHLGKGAPARQAATLSELVQSHRAPSRSCVSEAERPVRRAVWEIGGCRTRRAGDRRWSARRLCSSKHQPMFSRRSFGSPDAEGKELVMVNGSLRNANGKARGPQHLRIDGRGGRGVARTGRAETGMTCHTPTVTD